MSEQEHKRTQTLILSYLKYLKASNNISDSDGLDVVIGCLTDAFKLDNIQASAELLTIVNSSEHANVKSSSELKDFGNAAMKDKDYAKAEDFYTQAIQQSQKFGEPIDQLSIYYANRGAARQSQCNFNASIEDLKKALELNKEYTKARARLASVYESSGNKADALLTYQELLKTDSNNETYKNAVQRLQPQAVPAMPNIPGMPSMDEIREKVPGIDGIKDDPEVAELMKNPKVQALMAQMQTNPMAAVSAMSDPEIGPAFQKIIGKMMPGMAGMFGGAGGAGGMDFSKMFGQK